MDALELINLHLWAHKTDFKSHLVGFVVMVSIVSIIFL